tara:strand:+ start:1720 stop:1923 length:204 start_codon:yes stop_codon:yes gene_type:complete
MNGRVAKQLRKICPPMNPFTRRVYRKLKSQYKSLPHYAKRDFIELLKEKTIQVEPEQDGSVLDQEKV